MTNEEISRFLATASMSGRNSGKGDQTLLVQGRFLLYQNEDGQTGIEVRLQDETVWMTRAAMAELNQTTPQNITTHLRAICKDGELDEAANCKEYLQVQPGGAGGISQTKCLTASGILYTLPTN